MQRSRSKAAKVAARAISRSLAYQSLYQEKNISLAEITRSRDPLDLLPILTKEDIFERFSLQEMVASDVPMQNLAGVLTSSGHGGTNFAFGVSTRRDKGRAPFDIDLGLEQAFQIDTRSTLLVNCLPMGVVFESDTVCVANVSVREDMACAILQQAGPHFDQCILVLDPLFAKRLLDYARLIKMDWSVLHSSVILGEETFSEEFRSYLSKEIGALAVHDGQMRIGSSMGVGELGLNLFFECAETIAIRRALHHQDPDATAPTFFCYNPLRSLVEIVDVDETGYGDLVVTMLDEHAPIPMIRYRTGDKVRLLTDTDLRFLSSVERDAVASLPLPVIAHRGKTTAAQTAKTWSADQCKSLLYRDQSIADSFSGAFVLRKEEGIHCWEVQRSPFSEAPTETLTEPLQALTDETATRIGLEPLRVTVWPYQDFKWGMGLDHERKFRYVPKPAQHQAAKIVT
ncbi:MAG: hypothetical protein AAGI44_19130 [Pseudomonadota bacterium]